MKTVAELECQLFQLRERYDAKIEDRIKDLTLTGYFETAQPDSVDNPDVEIDALEDWMLELREKLVELKPETYHFGRVLKSKTSERFGKKYSRFGDNGYLVCRCCGGLFQYGSDNNEECELGSRNHISFESCSEHEGRKKSAEMKVVRESLDELPIEGGGVLRGALTDALTVDGNQINIKRR